MLSDNIRPIIYAQVVSEIGNVMPDFWACTYDTINRKIESLCLENTWDMVNLPGAIDDTEMNEYICQQMREVIND